MFLPRSGNEVYLKITAALGKTASSGSIIEVNNKMLRVVSSLVIYPREVGTFALLVPRDLYLGSNLATPSFGDIHFYSNDADRSAYAGSTGLLFWVFRLSCGKQCVAG